MSGPALLLIHGLGATSGVWHDVADAVDWPGRVVMPDLAGHGAAPWAGDYTVGSLAAAVAVSCGDAEPVVVVGHSLGGGVGICLGSGFFRPRVLGVLGLGIKVSWTDDDVERMAGVAARGVRWVESKDEAVERFLRNAGLAGVVGPHHPAVKNAVAQGPRGWRVAQHPLTFAQRALDMAGLMAAARCPVVLGAGEHDAMCPRSDLERFTGQPRIAEGAGHNVQLERPEWVVERIHELADQVA